MDTKLVLRELDYMAREANRAEWEAVVAWNRMMNFYWERGGPSLDQYLNSSHQHEVWVRSYDALSRAAFGG